MGLTDITQKKSLLGAGWVPDSRRRPWSIEGVHGFTHEIEVYPSVGETFFRRATNSNVTLSVVLAG